MTEYRAVIYDFDYTLADSSAGIVECINYVLREMGLPEAAPEKVKETIGLSLENTFIALAEENYHCQDNFDQFRELFIARADEVMAAMTKMYDPVGKVVKRLQEKGYAQGIVSTKFRYRIENILAGEGLLELFSIIVGGEDVAKHKPAPEGLLMAMKELGCEKNEVLYVGDSVADIEAAKRAGVDFVAVTTGKTDKEQFYKYQNKGVISDITGLLKWIN